MRANEQLYPQLASQLDLRDEVFQKNREQNLQLLTAVNEALAKSREGGGERYNKRHLERGKLLPRQRVELLLDRDSHFLELCALAGHGVDNHTTGSALIGGVEW